MSLPAAGVVVFLVVEGPPAWESRGRRGATLTRSDSERQGRAERRDSTSARVEFAAGAPRLVAWHRGPPPLDARLTTVNNREHSSGALNYSHVPSRGLCPEKWRGYLLHCTILYCTVLFSNQLAAAGRLDSSITILCIPLQSTELQYKSALSIRVVCPFVRATCQFRVSSREDATCDAMRCGGAIIRITAASSDASSPVAVPFI